MREAAVMSDQPEFPLSFGAQLRARRMELGWSLTRLSRQVNYSPGHLSKIENGVKAPSDAFVRRCDVLFDAGGALVAAHRAVPAGRVTTYGAPARGDHRDTVAGLGASAPRLGAAVGRPGHRHVVPDDV